MALIYIYMHTNKINNKKYIGQTKQDPERRWREGGKGYVNSPKFWNAIQKYGWDNFDHEIIEVIDGTPSEADEREIYWIAYYDTYNNDEKGYNMTPGGQNYMSELWQNAEYRENMKKSFSIARQKSWSDKDFAEKSLNSLLEGLHQSWDNEEWRANRIKAMRGDNNSNAKAVVNIETNKVFTTIKEAASWCGLNSVSGIGQCCRGKRKTSGKHPETGVPLHWKFLSDERSDEEILKDTISKNERKVICLNTKDIFNSMSEAARWCGLNDKGKSIKACCMGNQKTAGASPLTGERLSWSFAEGVMN